MNRKKGIIIGTTGIIIVTLALIGFTYGFYLSLISGNESSKKVKVTAGKSKLEYIELSNEIDTIIGPGYTNTKYFAVQNVGDISASYYIYLIDVENTFNRKEDIVYTIYRKEYDYSETNIEPESFDITATYDYSEWENVTNTYCSTVSEYTDYGDCQYPSEKSQLTTQKQTIMEQNDYYVYAFVVTYINQPDIDQIDDEESEFSGIVKIYADETGTDVSPFEPGTLADAIYLNALNKTNGTELSEPKSQILLESSSYSTGEYEEIELDCSSDTCFVSSSKEVVEGSAKYDLSTIDSCTDSYEDMYLYSQYNEYIGNGNGVAQIVGCNETNFILNQEKYEYEKILATTEDDYGIAYYYRGQVTDNYVNFNNKCWRILRIESDGAIKIILEDNDSLCESSDGTWSIGMGNIGYTYDYVTNSAGETSTEKVYVADYINGTTNSMKTKFDSWLTSSGIDTNKLKQDEWCIDNKEELYDDSGVLLTSTFNDLIYNQTSFNYYTFNRIFGYGIEPYATLKCDTNNYMRYKSYIGTLTADEAVFAGATYMTGYASYLYSTKYDYVSTLSLATYDSNPDNLFDTTITIHPDGGIINNPTTDSDYLRPAITLKAGTTYTEGGEGTQSNPYVVE